MIISCNLLNFTTIWVLHWVSPAGVHYCVATRCKIFDSLHSRGSWFAGLVKLSCSSSLPSYTGLVECTEQIEMNTFFPVPLRLLFLYTIDRKCWTLGFVVASVLM